MNLDKKQIVKTISLKILTVKIEKYLTIQL